MKSITGAILVLAGLTARDGGWGLIVAMLGITYFVVDWVQGVQRLRTECASVEPSDAKSE